MNMNNLQKGIAFIAIVLVAAAILGGGYVFVKQGEKNSLKTKDMTVSNVDVKNIQTISLTRDSKVYKISLQKFNPEYEVKIRDPKSNFNLSEPTDVLDALWSTPNKNTVLYLSLLDQNLQDKIKKTDKESGGQVLKDMTTFSSTSTIKTIFSYWVQTNVGNKTYRIFRGKQIINGKEWPGLSTTLVKSGENWLQSLDIDGTDLLRTIGTKTYEELILSGSTATTTSDWKTYTNAKYGFELKYPNNFFVGQNEFSTNFGLVMCPLEKTQQNPNSLISCGIKSALKVDYEDGMIYLFTYNDNNIKNKNQYFYLGRNSLDGRYYYLYAALDRFPEYKSIIEKMISTFKFTK